MAISDQEKERALDLFSGLGGLSTRRMFGGLAIYHDGTVFAILRSDGVLMLKGAGDMIDRFDAMNLERWTYQRPGRKATAMPYWVLPDSALDDPEEATALAREAIRHL